MKKILILLTIIVTFCTLTMDAIAQNGNNSNANTPPTGITLTSIANNNSVSKEASSTTIANQSDISSFDITPAAPGIINITGLSAEVYILLDEVSNPSVVFVYTPSSTGTGTTLTVSIVDHDFSNTGQFISNPSGLAAINFPHL